MKILFIETRRVKVRRKGKGICRADFYADAALAASRKIKDVSRGRFFLFAFSFLSLNRAD